jgi:hypothetical protein
MARMATPALLGGSVTAMKHSPGNDDVNALIILIALYFFGFIVIGGIIGGYVFLALSI